MNGYRVIVFFHVLSAILWVGGGALLQLLLWRAKKAGPESFGSFTEAAEWTSQRFFMPMSFAALGFGIWAVLAGPWSFGESWIVAGIVGYAISALIGMAILGPTAKKMKAMIGERGPNDPVVTQLSRRIDLAGRVDLVILLAVVFNMVVKPGV